MGRSIALVTPVVRDYDEAIAFFIEALPFAVLEDTPLGDGKRGNLTDIVIRHYHGGVIDCRFVTVVDDGSL
jgi:catechol 2,3-dioxygenase-like lactoylglutathione lyase family enzyme